MRIAALLSVLLLVGACAPSAPAPAAPAPPSTDRLVAFVNALSADEYTTVFLDELETRLGAEGHALTGAQRDALRPVLTEGAEAQRMVIRAHATSPDPALSTRLEEMSARTDAAAEPVLSAPQRPVYRTLRVEARAAILREFGDR